MGSPSLSSASGEWSGTDTYRRTFAVAEFLAAPPQHPPPPPAAASVLSAGLQDEPYVPSPRTALALLAERTQQRTAGLSPQPPVGSEPGQSSRHSIEPVSVPSTPRDGYTASFVASLAVGEQRNSGAGEQRAEPAAVDTPRSHTQDSGSAGYAPMTSTAAASATSAGAAAGAGGQSGLYRTLLDRIRSSAFSPEPASSSPQPQPQHASPHSRTGSPRKQMGLMVESGGGLGSSPRVTPEVERVPQSLQLWRSMLKSLETDSNLS